MHSTYKVSYQVIDEDQVLNTGIAVSFINSPSKYLWSTCLALALNKRDDRHICPQADESQVLC